MTDTELRLLQSFPNSFINYNGEFIAHNETNESFWMANCKNDLEIKCKVLEWLSRGACKAELHKFMIGGINRFLETKFSEEDMELIYKYLGNGLNRKLCISFVESGYKMELLRNPAAAV